ncbi:MAG: hypothetical protein ABI780_12075, partial [Ardenticatenales bacterium]
MTLWPILPAVSLAALLCVQVVSVVLCLRRLRRPTVLADTAALPAISILRPVCGLENHLDATLRSTFRLDTGRDDTVRDDTVRDDTVRSDTVRSDTGPFEILFCVARADDAAAPLV